jgi:hypothetical protein
MPTWGRVAHAVATVRYPAQRWEVLAGAASRMDRVTASRLARLPARTYDDVDAVLDAIFPRPQPVAPS